MAISLDIEIQNFSQMCERYIKFMPSSEVEAELTEQRDNIMMHPEDDLEEQACRTLEQDSKEIIAQLRQSSEELIAESNRLKTELDNMHIQLSAMNEQLNLSLDEKEKLSARNARLQTARDSYAQDRDALANYKQNVQSTIDASEAFFARLVIKQLLPLATDYRDYLQDLSDENASHKNTLRWNVILDNKLELLKLLVKDLHEVNQSRTKVDHPLKNQCYVEHFYQVLDNRDNKAELKKHRDPHWARFLRNALAVFAILVTGILPGMLVLACLAQQKTRSMEFWKPRGAGFFDTAQKYRECKISIAVDQRHNPHDVISPMVSPNS